MFPFMKALANAVKKARGKQGLTQRQLAELADVDIRTVLNIENDRGNPKLQVLYSLVRALHIDANIIFYPESYQDISAVHELRMVLMECTEEEAAALIPIIKTIRSVLKSHNTMDV